MYTKNGVSLLAQVAVENDISSFEKRIDQHELDYNRTTMLINKHVKYDFSDKKIPKGSSLLFYRLKQVDYNGTFEYSNIEKVTISIEKIKKRL
ncbi:MAG: hypothetical protein M3512_13615 [Bacteroidota bacterium]|nr:hypothetical protein [Bacteroidota bacterium]